MYSSLRLSAKGDEHNPALLSSVFHDDDDYYLAIITRIRVFHLNYNAGVRNLYNKKPINLKIV